MTVRETLHKSGRLFRLDLVPGTYRLTATLPGGGTIGARPVTVTILAGESVRQDVFIDVP